MKYLWNFIVLTCLGALPLAAQDAPRPAKVFTIQEETSELVRRYPGIVLPSQEVELSFRVSGNMIELPIRGSVQVAKGDVIAQLDTRDFKAQKAQLQSQKDQASAELQVLQSGARPQEIAGLEAGVAAAQAEVDRLLDQAERTRTLALNGTVSTARLEQDEAALRVAQAQLRSTQENLAIGLEGGRPEEIAAAEAAIRGIDAQIEAVENNIADATLRAPFDGIIARRDVDNFANIQAGQPIALLQALSVIHVSFDVPSPDVTALTKGGTDKITNHVVLDALPGQVLPSVTVEFSVQADSASQTYRGRVAVQVPEDALILPGMVGTVISSAPRVAPQMTIPITALSATASGDPKVWVVEDTGAVAERTVSLGEVTGVVVVVTDGLSPGETIVSAGVSALRAGMVVRPVEKIGG